MADVDTFVLANMTLSLVGDLANGSKHLVLTSTKTGDLTTGFGDMHFQGDPTIGLVTRFEVLSSGAVFDAIDVARSALAQWDTYLKRVKLRAALGGDQGATGVGITADHTGSQLAGAVGSEGVGPSVGHRSQAVE